MTTDKVPFPTDLNAEMLVVRVLITDPSQCARVGDLSGYDFFDPLLAKIFEATIARFRSGKNMDLAELAEDLDPDTLAEVGGIEFLHRLRDAQCLACNIVDGAVGLRDLAIRRNLVAFYIACREEAEEGILLARGIETRLGVNALLVKTGLRMAEHYAQLSALVANSVLLPERPSSLTKSVALLLNEIQELAANHDRVAAVEEERRDHPAAQRRRDRADQLRGIASGLTR